MTDWGTIYCVALAGTVALVYGVIVLPLLEDMRRYAQARATELRVFPRP